MVPQNEVHLLIFAKGKLYEIKWDFVIFCINCSKKISFFNKKFRIIDDFYEWLNIVNSILSFFIFIYFRYILSIDIVLILFRYHVIDIDMIMIFEKKITLIWFQLSELLIIQLIQKQRKKNFHFFKSDK